MNTKNMPAGLARYWKSRGAHKAIKRKLKKPTHRAKKKRAVVKRRSLTRRVNPVTVFKIAIQKGKNRASRLYLTHDKLKFSRVAKSHTFKSVGEAKQVAHRLMNTHRSVLSGYDFLLVPANR